jgi:SAM-dependent methyltransferase
MGEDRGLIPTPPTTGSEYQRWSAIFAGDEYYYGSEPGPVARRAVRYHRQHRPRGGAALDAGCGEGQDLAFLAERGYVATGTEFTEAGIAKAERLLRSRNLEAELVNQDLRSYEPGRRFDLVLAVNSVQFLAGDGPSCLRRLVATVIPGGVFGISVFARPLAGDREALEEAVPVSRSNPSGTFGGDPRFVPHVSHGIWLLSIEELLDYFTGWQMLEAARLWQWNPHTNQPQPFLTLIARNVPADPPPLPLP